MGAIITQMMMFKGYGKYLSIPPTTEPDIEEEINPSYTPTHYVSNSGSNSADGLTPETAWKNASAAFNGRDPAPGDIIAFECGGEWDEIIQLYARSGISGNPITIGAYGNGLRPKFYGSNYVNGWTLDSGNIWKTSLLQTPDEIFVNNKKLRIARDAIHTITSATSNTITSSSLNPAINYEGATILIRINAWIIDTKTVISSSGTTLTLNATTMDTMEVGYGFYLMNKKEFLSEGEWWYDSVAKELFVWKEDSTQPTLNEVKSATGSYQNALLTGTGSYVTIRDISFEQSYNGVNVSGQNYHIDNCRFTYNNYSGINLIGNNHKITNTKVMGASLFGIFVTGDNTLIQDCNIFDIGLLENIGKLGFYISDTTGKGIHIEGSNNVIEYNRVDNIAFNGISFYNTAIVRYNHVTRAGATKTDAGGINTWTSNPASPANSGSEVYGNIVHNIYGNCWGMPSQVSEAHGIYMDNNSGGIDIENNIVFDCEDSCIFLHENKNQLVKNNKFLGAFKTLLQVMDTGVNTFQNNEVALQNVSTQYLSVEKFLSNTHNYSGNKYVGNTTNKLFVKTENWDPSTGELYTFAGWKSLTGQDTTSVMRERGSNEIRMLYNPTKLSKTFQLNGATVNDIDGNSITTDIVLQPFTGMIVTGMNLELIA